MDKTKIILAATKYVQKGQYDKAIGEYRRILQKDPKDVRTLLKIGELQQKKGENEAAASTLHDVANAYAADGFFLKAIAVFKQVLKLSPERVAVILRLAELYQQLGLMQDAMAQLQAAAGHYEKTGAMTDSVEILRRMVALEPENLASRLRLADSLARQEKNQEALQELRRAAEKLRGGSRIEDYLRVGDRIVRLDPKDQNLGRELAQAYLAKNDVRRALERLQICFQEDPKNPETLELLARAFVGVGQRAKAASVYKELARVHRDRSHGADEMAAWRKVLESAPDDPEAKLALEAFARSGTGGRPPAPPVLDEPSAFQPPVPQPEPSRPGIARPEPSWPGARDLPPQPQPPRETSRPAAPRAEPSRPSVPRAEPSRPSVAQPEATQPPAQQLSRLLTEMDVFVKYGLADKARAHLEKIFAIDPNSIAGHEKAVVLLRGRDEKALHVSLAALARLHARSSDFERGRPYFEELSAASPTSAEVLALAPLYGSAVPLHDISDDLILAGGTGPIELAHDLPGDDEPLILPVALDEEAVVVERDAPAFLQVNEDALFELANDPGEHTEEVVDEPLLGDPDEDPTDTAPAEETVDLVLPDGDELLSFDHDAETRAAPAIGIDANGARTELALLPDDEVLGLTPMAPYSVEDTGQVDYEAVTAKQDPFGAGVEAAERPLEPGLTPEPRTHGPAADANPWRAGDLELQEILNELDEAEFYLQQGMLDEAEELYRSVERRVPGHAQATARLGEIAARRVSNDLTPGPAAPAQDEADVALDGLFDLGAALAQELGGEPFARNDGQFQFSSLDVLRQGQRGGVRPEDVETLYNLGIAYKEMGLFADAITAFEQALSGSDGQPRAIDCCTMIGLCHGSMGDHAGAVEAYRRGLAQQGVSTDVEKALHFEIALALEAAGRLDDALAAYGVVARLDGAFRDVKAAIARLVAAGAVPRPFAGPTGLRTGSL